MHSVSFPAVNQDNFSHDKLPRAMGRASCFFLGTGEESLQFATGTLVILYPLKSIEMLCSSKMLNNVGTFILARVSRLCPLFLDWQIAVVSKRC